MTFRFSSNEYRLTIHLSLPIVRPKGGERVPPIKTQARSATILPNFVGLIFQVHNGKIYNDVRITEDMVGHKLGEFSAYVQFCRRNWKDQSDTRQHTKALHVQADEEQVEGENGLHGNGANASFGRLYHRREQCKIFVYYGAWD